MSRAALLAPRNVDQPTPVERTYLEVIAYLEDRREPVIAAQLARWLRVRPPTVTGVVQRLEQKQLILREGAGAIRLTPAGRVIAATIIRRHRLIECFLHAVLGIAWHEIHREATLLEPAISPALEERIVALVGAATTCPHGNPIPGHAELSAGETRLNRIGVGERFTITRIDEEAGEDSCTLQLLWTRRLIPGTQLIRLPDPAHGIALQRDGRRVVIARRVAGLLWGRAEPEGDAENRDAE